MTRERTGENKHRTEQAERGLRILQALLKGVKRGAFQEKGPG